jgi:replicative DNA helicase
MTAEWLILGAVLDAASFKADPRDLIESSGLTGDDFPDRRARAGWISATSLAEHKRPVNATTVFMAAKSMGQVADGDIPIFQGAQSRNSLNRETFAQAAESYRHAARGLAVAAQLRSLADDIEQRRQSVARVSGNLEGLASSLTSQWAPDHTGEEDVYEVLGEWDHAGQPGGKPLVVRTGVDILDAKDLKFRGWSPNLNLVIGQPSVGKSSLEAASIIAHIRAGGRPGLFGIEDGTKWLFRRLAAAELGIPVADVGQVPYTSEQVDRIAQLGPEWAAMLREMTVFKMNHISIEELVRRGTHWIKNRGVTEIWVDHLGQITHRRSDREDHRHAVGRSLKNMRALAERYQTPVICLAHTGRPDPRDREERPPMLTEIAETADAERSAYKVIGLWRKSGAMRATVLKNKDGPRDVTVSLGMVADSALVDCAAGEMIDLARERAAERRAKNEEREARMKAARDARYAESMERKRQIAAEKAAAGKLLEGKKKNEAKPQQADLLGGPKA